MTDTHSNAMSVSLTCVQSVSDIGKRFFTPDDKTIVKQVLGMLYAGTATTQILNGATPGVILKKLGKIIVGLHGNNVLLMGTAVNGKPVNTLTTKAREGQVAGEIARSKDNFAYADQLSFILADDDDGRGTRDVLCRIYPPFKEVAMLSLPSSSSAVTLNGNPYKNGGEHTYMLLLGGRHREVLRRLLELCAVRGLARIMISKNGRMLLRGPVDASVWGAERVIFAGTPHVVAPVEQAPREPELHEGDVLNADLFLSDTERLVDPAELKRVIDEMKAEKLGEADRVAEEWGRNNLKETVAKQTVAKQTVARETVAKDAVVKETAAKETVRKRAEAQVKRMVDKVKRANRVDGPAWDEREHEVLEADFVITLSDGTQVTVREICAGPAKYDEKHCADPIEGVDYGSSTATILVNGAGKPWVYSHAHGASTDYSLVVRELIDASHPFATMTHEERLTAVSGRGKCPKPGTPGYAEEAGRRGRDAELLIRAAVDADADDTVMASLRQALAYMSPMGLQEIKKLQRDAREQKRGFDRENAADDRTDNEVDTFGNLLASIGLPPDARVADIVARHQAVFAFDQEAKAIVRLDSLAYTATPYEHHAIWAPCKLANADGDGVPISIAWMNNRRRLTVEGSRMRPDMPLPLYSERGKTWRNLYRPPAHPAAGGDVAVFVEMLQWMLPDTVEREWFVDWLAHKLRKPHVRATAVVMIAVTKTQDQSFGTGRGMLFKVIALLFGEEYVRPVGYAELTGKGSQAAFNDYLDALVVMVNEAASSADDLKYHERRAAYEHLKDIIDPSLVKVRIKTKYGKIRDIITYSSFVIASNHTNALAIAPSDRRFTVLRNGPPLPREMRYRIAGWMEDAKNIGALFRWLGERDLSRFEPYEPLETAAKQRMERHGLSALDHLLAEARAALPGKAFVLPQLTSWINHNGADDRELAGDGNWHIQLNAAIRQHCRRLVKQDGAPYRVRMRHGKRYTVYCWAGDEDEMTALGASSQQSLIDEVIKNNQDAGASTFGFYRTDAFVDRQDGKDDDDEDSAKVAEVDASDQAEKLH